jgi:exonuclease III
VVYLQELKSTDTDFPVAAIRRGSYEAVWRGQKDMEWGRHPGARNAAFQSGYFDPR